jgi:hypothetical protein
MLHTKDNIEMDSKERDREDTATTVLGSTENAAAVMTFTSVHIRY